MGDDDIQLQNLSLAKSLYILYESLPNKDQQVFLDELQKNYPKRLENCDLLASQNTNNANNEEFLAQNNSRTEEHQKRAIEIYDDYRDDLKKRQLSNDENYDKTILTLSSSGLALSLTAIKFAIPLATAKYLCLIKVSWWLFGLAIFTSIIAYRVSNKALDLQLENAEEYYVKGNEEAFSKENCYSSFNNMLNKVSGSTFLIATISIILFVTLNINSGESNMNDKVVQTISTGGSASVPKMQTLTPSRNEKLSATVPAMQLAPSKPPSQQTTQTSGGNNDSAKGK